MLYEKLLYVYTTNFMEKQVSLPKFMNVAFLLGTPIFIIHARRDEHCTMCSGEQVSAHWTLKNTMNAIGYRLLEHWDEHVDRPKAVKKS